jgi:eukaryotic-like serine/threonine-protein kinase
MPDDATRPLRPFDGRYQLIGRLGQGGMATVYAAEDLTLGRKVAIKVLAEQYAEDEQFVERFRREAKAAASLNHPNIVAIYDRGEAEGTYYIAMEHLEGRTLKDVIRETGPMAADAAIEYALQALSALGFAHEHGVIHRDVKPQNMLLARDGRIKVTDFGIARAGASDMTEVGSIVGTAQYLAPEQARGQTVGPQADIYSLGVVLYELLTGRVPFEGDSAVAIAMKHVSEEPLPPSRLVPSIPPGVEQVVLRALAKDPRMRYPSAASMADDLERARAGRQPAARPRQVTQVMPPPRPQVPVAAQPPRRSWPWIPVVVLLLAVGAIAAFALGAFDDDPGTDSSSTSTTSTTTSTQATVVPVPDDLIGAQYEQAAASLDSVGLVARRQDVRNNAPRGEVVGAVPEPGRQVAPGSDVTLKVSRGTAPVIDVTGSSLADATAALENAGFVAKSTEVESDEATGTVVEQSPQPNETLAVGGTVTLSVSRGPAEVPVPDVTNQDAASARSTLEAAGFTVGTGRTESDSVPAGSVVSQDPTGGSPAPTGSRVMIVLSSGPPKIVVPDVQDLLEDDAIAALQEAGLNAQPSDIAVTDPAQDGVVVRQSPIGGNRVEPGKNVIIRIGRLAAVPEDGTVVP